MGNLVPDATMENILYYINKAKELGLSVRCVKFHTNNSQFNENGFVSQYVNKVLEITEIKNGRKVNEVSSNYDSNFIYRVGEINE